MVPPVLAPVPLPDVALKVLLGHAHLVLYDLLLAPLAGGSARLGVLDQEVLDARVGRPLLAFLGRNYGSCQGFYENKNR